MRIYNLKSISPPRFAWFNNLIFFGDSATYYNDRIFKIGNSIDGKSFIIVILNCNV